MFNLSGRVARGIENKKKEKVKINFLYGLNIKNIKEFIIWMDKRSKILKDRTIAENLESVINYKLVDVFLKLVNISKSAKWNELTDKQKTSIARKFVEFDLNITGTNSFDKAQVCTGGVLLSEINTKTMESKKEKGLYITGELLDADGDCGGYNLEWAWITGIIAGRSIK